MRKIVFALLIPAAFLFLTNASVWEGSAAVAPSGSLPDEGFYAATNSFPRNTVVDITNLESGRTIRVIVAAGLDTPGLLALVSREAAESIGLNNRAVGRIRMIQPSDPIAFSRGGEGASGDPDWDPSAAVPAYDTDDGWPTSDSYLDSIAAGPVTDGLGVAAPSASVLPDPAVSPSADPYAVDESYLPPPAAAYDGVSPDPVPSWVNSDGLPAAAPAFTETMGPAPVTAAEIAPLPEAAPASAEIAPLPGSSPAAGGVPASAEIAPLPNPAPAAVAPAAAPVPASPAPAGAPAYTANPGAYNYSLVPSTARPPQAPEVAPLPEKKPGVITADQVVNPLPQAAKKPEKNIENLTYIEPVKEPAAKNPETAVLAETVGPVKSEASPAEKPAAPDSAAFVGPVPPKPAPVPQAPEATAFVAPVPPKPAPEPEIPSAAAFVQPVPPKPAPAAAAVAPAAAVPPAAAIAAAPEVGPIQYRPAPVVPRAERVVIPPESEVAPIPAKKAPEAVPVTPAPVAEAEPEFVETPRFSAPQIAALEKGKYYLQLGAFSKSDSVEDVLAKLGKGYPLAVWNIGGDEKPLYRVLVGPVNLGESNALLQRFKGSGYKDAFVRRGN